MNTKEIEELMEAMERHQVSKLGIKKKDFEVLLEKGGACAQPQPAPMVHHQPVQAAAKAAEPPKQEPEGRFITSPIVGTFYAASSPEDAPYVNVGDSVSEEDVVCIIEAMKVMNEVKADLKGSVVEVLVKSGDPVEFGTKLFRVT